MNAARDLIEFSHWLDAVNKQVESATGRSIDGLPRWGWREAFERDFTPGESIALWARQLKRLAKHLEEIVPEEVNECR